ncbi:hypothetical protein KC866_02950 [Patescibacteria group bacterium]|nr:hypothetical protein [Patescibacteria group bacterium]
MNNSNFNIINQLVQEQKSLWRIENHYINEAQTDEERAFWEELRDAKIVHIAQLTAMAQQSLN